MDSKKSVEAVLLGGALVVTLGGTMLPMTANAATICSLSTTGQGSTVTGATTNFVKVDFAAKCSPNTVVNYGQSAQAFAAKGGSKKGSFVYASTTEGGGGAQKCGTSVTDPTNGLTDPTNFTNPCSG